MVEPRDASVSIGRLRLHFLDWGDNGKPPMLLLHGGLAHAHWWDLIAPLMTDCYRVLALDLRGHGDSEWDESATYGVEAHASDVAGFLRAMRLEAVTLVGHSFGGQVAIKAAADSESRPAALIVIDSTTRIGVRAARFMESLRKLPQPVYRSFDDAVRRFRLLPTDHRTSPEVLHHMARYAVRRQDDGTWTFKFDRRAMVNTEPSDLTGELRALRCPLLVVRGAESKLIPASILDDFVEAAPHAECRAIPGAYHHVMLDQPQTLANVMREFLLGRRTAR
jgi:pimeloyl-ACP methyl ester carboxylesterase